MKRFADLVIEKRLIFLSIIILITIFFSYQIFTKLTVKTIFSDLLPKNHAYVNLHNEIRKNFGGANQAYIMVQVRDKKDGGQYDDVFNTETLNIVRNITLDLLRFNAVDRFKIMSLSSNKLKHVKMSAEGMAIKSIMYPDVPKTQEAMDALRRNVYGSSMAYPAIVSLDSKKTLITVDFFEDEIDYKTCFNELRALRYKYEDDNHIIAIAGEPMNLGYIDYYVKDILKVLSYTVIAMLILFLIYFRSKRGMLLPVFAAGVSAIWGLGFLSLVGFNLDPLVLVFPFLIAARTAGHAVQVIKRYIEECGECNDNKEACKRAIRYLFRPGFTGIVTDAAGIMLIALTPLKILQKITFTCAFWSIATVVIALLLVPCILACFPFPHTLVLS